VNKFYGIGALTLTVAMTGWASDAEAQVACSSLDNPVVVSGSTAVQPFLAEVAKSLSGGTGDKKLSVVFKSSGSCSGVATLAADTTPDGACTTASCVSGTALYWTADGEASKPSTCTLAADGQHVDLTLSDVYKESCEGVSGLDALLDQTFTVIPFAFIVPHASSQVAIDAREAYYAYGLGPAGMVKPWVNKDMLFQRSNTSGTQITVFKNVRIPVGSNNGVDAKSGGNMLSSVAAASDAEAAIGFAGTDAIDSKRSSVTVLAYRHFDQKSYYYPDSSFTSFDKKNVRDGHYPLWGYEHMLLRKDSSGKALSAAGQKLADVLTEKTALPGTKTATEIAVKSSLVPLCAMKVDRKTDGGDFSVYKPEAACGCFFDKNVTSGDTKCTPCKANADCSSSESCNLGYCEAK
jgi:ABC-type phosphate transport system substrate-binding protein